MNNIGYERVRELFDYDLNNGCLIWKIKLNNFIKIGAVAGYTNEQGYRMVGIDSKPYGVHRIIWLWHYGYLPENQIDHIDQDPQNNHINNLREVSMACNLRNTGNRKTNTSGVKGVGWHRLTKTWWAAIGVMGKKINLGYHKNFDDAVMARYKKEKELNWSGCESTSPAFLYLQRKNLIEV